MYLFTLLICTWSQILQKASSSQLSTNFKGILSPGLVPKYIMQKLLLNMMHIVLRLKNCVFSLKINFYFKKLVIVWYPTRLLQSKSRNPTRLLNPKLKPEQVTPNIFLSNTVRFRVLDRVTWLGYEIWTLVTSLGTQLLQAFGRKS